jgi:hypothetical protein
MLHAKHVLMAIAIVSAGILGFVSARLSFVPTSHEASAHGADAPRAMDFEERMKADKDMMRRYFETLDSLRDGQSIDPAFADVVRQKVMTVISEGSLSGLGLEAVSCSTSLCRIDLAYSTPISGASVVHVLARQLRYEVSGFTTYSVEDANRMAIYLSRAGSTLPRIEGL